MKRASYLHFNPCTKIVLLFLCIVISSLLSSIEYELIFVSIIAFFSIINKKIKFNRKEFVSYLTNISLVFALLLGLIYFSDTQRTYSFLEFVGEAFLLEVVLISVILMVGLNKTEKDFLFSYLRKRVKR